MSLTACSEYSGTKLPKVVACQDDYIRIDRSTPSRSGLYGTDLPGVEIDLLENLTKDDQEDYQDVWEMIYNRAWQNLVSDVTKALQEKFYVDAKLVSRETSEFKDDANSGSELAGVRLHFYLPKYARIHVLSVGVLSNQSYGSPGITLYFHKDNADGELLHQVSESLDEGRNTIFVDTDFEVDDLFIGYDPDSFELRQTENKYYQNLWNYWDKLTCMWPCLGSTAEVRQINGGGLNVKYTIECSIEKYVCENLKFFRNAFWYRIGLELVVERRFGNRLNQFTTMTIERATELFDFYNNQYQQELMNSTKAVNVDEDPFCFNCKGIVNSRVNLP